MDLRVGNFTEEVQMSFPKELRMGFDGDAVVHLQVFLLGNERGVGELQPHGEFDEATKKALMLLQDRLGIKSDGIFGPKTKEAIKNRFHLDFDIIQADAYFVPGP